MITCSSLFLNVVCVNYFCLIFLVKGFVGLFVLDLCGRVSNCVSHEYEACPIEIGCY
jgi:hypothetical protein